MPYALVKKKVEARYTAATVEILFKGNRVASHLRSYRKGKHTTTPEHMPSSHRRYAEWTPQRIQRWAAGIGPETEKYVASLMESRPHPEQGFRAALGIMRLAKQYGKERIEAACKRASAFRIYSYRGVASILATGVDKKESKRESRVAPVILHDNIRGPGYYH